MWKGANKMFYSEPNKIHKEVSIGLNNIGIVDEVTKNGDFSKDEFGLCYDCRWLFGIKTEYGKTYGRCELQDITLNSIDKIKKCTRYTRIGCMSIGDMKEIAHIIEVDKNVIGF